MRITHGQPVSDAMMVACRIHHVVPNERRLLGLFRTILSVANLEKQPTDRGARLAYHAVNRRPNRFSAIPPRSFHSFIHIKTALERGFLIGGIKLPIKQ